MKRGRRSTDSPLWTARCERGLKPLRLPQGHFRGGELPKRTHTHTDTRTTKRCSNRPPPFTHWCWALQSSFVQSFRLTALDPCGDQNIFLSIETIPLQQLSGPRHFHGISMISGRKKDDSDLFSLRVENPKAFPTKPESKLASCLQTAHCDA